MQQIIEEAQLLLKKVKRAKIWLSLNKKADEWQSLARQMDQPGFWSQPEKAKKISQRAAELKEVLDVWQNLKQDLENLISLAQLAQQEKDDSISVDLSDKLATAQKQLALLERQVIFGGPYDSSNALLAIHAGAGGTDAQDWAQMLERMYLRFFEKKDWRVKIVDRQSGQTAGLKSVLMEVSGRSAYGYLKSEAGVHRLVRISPFDAEKMRHTSFVLVEVLPELEEIEDIKLKEQDLQIETFKSTGHGGQSVNTTDSAVRIKHLPTGITVTCRNERSQLQNRQTALKILKSKLRQYEQAELEEEKKRLRGEFSEAAWGNQIRSYVLHPYKLVKDHRSGYETQEVEKILDGGLDEIIMAYLEHSSHQPHKNKKSSH
jgi:peptide chain release factor 2